MLNESKTPYKSGFMIKLSDDERRIIHKISMLPAPPNPEQISEAQVVLKTLKRRGLDLVSTQTFNSALAAETFAESLAKMLAPLEAPDESDHTANAKVAWDTAMEGVSEGDLKHR